MGRFIRRQFLVALGATALANPIASFAQKAANVPRLGALTILSEGGARTRQRMLHEALGRAGYTVGQNIFVEWRFADGKSDRLPVLADDLVRRKVDAIVAFADLAIHAAAGATKTIPIVMFHYVQDPVKEGLVASLSHPGGNVTGITWSPDPIALSTKQYEVLKAAAPGAVRVASLWDPWTPNVSRDYQLANDVKDHVKKSLGLVVTNFVPRNDEEFQTVLDRIAAFKPDALYVCTCPIIWPRVGEVAAFTLQHKLVALGNASVYVENGGLMSYSHNWMYMNDRVISFVDRILRGASPAKLPVEQPAKFELLFNARTARAMGYSLPPELRIRVDRVIE